MRALRTLVVVGLIAIAGWTPTCAAERVDLLLILAADVSGSMDDSKFDLQRSGYAAAFSNPRVIEAIRAGPNGRIAIAFIEWSGILQQKIVIDSNQNSIAIESAVTLSLKAPQIQIEASGILTLKGGMVKIN